MPITIDIIHGVLFYAVTDITAIFKIHNNFLTVSIMMQSPFPYSKAVYLAMAMAGLQEELHQVSSNHEIHDYGKSYTIIHCSVNY